MSRYINFRSYIPGIAWFVVLNVLLFLPGSDLPKASDWMAKIHFDKIVHLGLFGLLGLLFALPLRTRPGRVAPHYFAWIITLGSWWGLISELIQHQWVPNRSMDMGDWLADTAGVALGVWFSGPAARLFFKKRNPLSLTP